MALDQTADNARAEPGSRSYRAVDPAGSQERITSRVPVICVCWLVVELGCAGSGGDSWQHYTGGGMYLAGSPSIAPDGCTIIYSSPRTGNGDIYQVGRDGTNSIRLTNDRAYEAYPMYSPDGTRIAFCREADGFCHIWTMAKDGTNQQQVTHGRVWDRLYGFSPDGSRVNISRSDIPRVMLGLGLTAVDLAVDLTNDRRSAKKLDGVPEYSQDGRITAHTIYDVSRHRSEIWLADLGGTNKRFFAAGVAPQISPDANWILYGRESGSGPGFTWMIANVDRSVLRELGRFQDLYFAPDGAHVVALSADWQPEIWKMDLDGRNRTPLKVPRGYTTGLRRYSDGFVFAVASGNDRVGDIYVLDSEHWTVQHVASMR